MEQLTAPVRWTQSVQNMIADGATLFVEMGPGKVCARFGEKINKDSQVQSIVEGLVVTKLV